MTKRDVVFYIGMWVTGVIYILLKGTLMRILGSPLLDIDLVVIVIGYIYLRYGPVYAGCFAFGQGLIMDAYSGGVQGLFVVLYMAVLGIILLSALVFDLSSSKGQIIIIISSLMIKKFLLFIVLFLISSPFFIPRPALGIFLISVVLTGLLAPIVFYVLGRMRMAIVCPNGAPSSGIFMEEQDL